MVKLSTLIFTGFLLGTSAALSHGSISEDTVLALRGAALAGERSAVRTLFDLYPLADGAATEDIDVILGEVAREHPRLFLEELSADATRLACSNISNTGELLVDQLDGMLEELKRRRDSLLSVSEGSLIGLRDECVSQLEESIRDLAAISEGAT